MDVKCFEHALFNKLEAKNEPVVLKGKSIPSRDS